MPSTIYFRPHHVDPSKQKIRLAFAYKNFAAQKGISHIGLGVSLDNTRRELQDHGIFSTIWPITSLAELVKKVEDDESKPHPYPPLSHVLISAAWLPATGLMGLARRFENIQFVVLIHSNVGFLQADAAGVANIRDYLQLEVAIHNFSLAGNNLTFVEWARRTYRARCEYLPNLYHLKNVQFHPRRLWEGGTLRIGCLGALRPQKNLMTSVAGALEIASRVHAGDTEIWISVGRDDAGGGILAAIRAMTRNIVGVRLIEHNWESWAGFRQTIARMDLLIQPSYTESFNMVTADGIVEGIPSVVSEAIEWVPDRWKADSDDASDVARVGTYLIGDTYAATEGWAALRDYVTIGIRSWFSFLQVPEED